MKLFPISTNISLQVSHRSEISTFYVPYQVEWGDKKLEDYQATTWTFGYSYHIIYWLGWENVAADT